MDLIFVLRIISNWFIRIGVVIACIVLIYFLVSLKFFVAFLYLIGLAFAFFFGYFFMYLLDLFLVND